MFRLVTRLLVALGAIGALAIPAFAADSSTYGTTFVQLGPSVPGVLYQSRTASPKNAVGLVLMHPFGSYLSHLGCSELSSRGYTVLCADPHTVNQAPGTYNIEEQMPDVARAVRYMRARSDIRTVLLAGHSAGGPMMTVYQAIAENGPAVCQGPEKITPCPASLASLPPADGVFLMDSHGGYGYTTLTYVDPSVISDLDPTERDDRLDMYSASNGFSRTGANYTADFRHQFLAAQGDRNDRLIARALQRREALDSGEGLFPDDEPFTVPGDRARIFQPDLHLQVRTHDVHPLLHPDGSQTSEIIRSVRVPSGGAAEARSFNPGVLQTSVRNFLSSNATRTTPEYDLSEDQILGVDWASSTSNAPWAVEHITVPLLIMPMTGHYFMVTDETIFNHAISKDKSMVFVDGAVHGLTTCKACERFPGEFGDTAKTLFNYADTWLASRFVTKVPAN